MCVCVHACARVCVWAWFCVCVCIYMCEGAQGGQERMLRLWFLMREHHDQAHSSEARGRSSHMVVQQRVGLTLGTGFLCK